MFQYLKRTTIRKIVLIAVFFYSTVAMHSGKTYNEFLRQLDKFLDHSVSSLSHERCDEEILFIMSLENCLLYDPELLKVGIKFSRNAVASSETLSTGIKKEDMAEFYRQLQSRNTANAKTIADYIQKNFSDLM